MPTETLEPENSHEPLDHKHQATKLEERLKRKAGKRKGGRESIYIQREAHAAEQGLLDLKLEGASALTLARNSKVLHLFLADTLRLIFQTLM